MDNPLKGYQPSVTKEQYTELVQDTADKDLSALNRDLEKAVTLVVSRHRHMKDRNDEESDEMLSVLLDRLTIAQRNRNNLQHMLESIAWYEEYTRSR